MGLRSKGTVGKEAQEKLERANIYANKNTIPGDSKPVNPSGLQLGTPAVTTRGMKEKEMEKIAEWINDVISDPSKIPLVKQEVIELCSRFPVP